MIKFYYSGAPNPMKVALMLEETGLSYEPVPVDTRKGEQHKPDYLAINPNAKVPSIVDGDVKVFDSSAILMYLAEKTGKFLPEKSDKARAELLSWMFFISSGVGPYPPTLSPTGRGRSAVRVETLKQAALSKPSSLSVRGQQKSRPLRRQGPRVPPPSGANARRSIGRSHQPDLLSLRRRAVIGGTPSPSARKIKEDGWAASMQPSCPGRSAA
jgi:hypothetical protein